MAPRIALGFFGLDRFPSICHPTIVRHVIEPARAFGRVTLLGHFNVPSRIDNRHGTELAMVFRPQPSLLDLELTWNEAQPDAPPVWMHFAHDVPFLNQTDPGAVMRTNAMWQLWSLQRLWTMIRLAAADADLVILSRADLQYLDPLDVPAVAARVRTGAAIITPNWHQHRGRNDRIAVCTMAGAEVYCQRVEAAMEYCRRYEHFHPESVLRFAIDASRLPEAFLATRANRVRATGAIVQENFV